jgi:hypothetical protein
VHIAAPLAEAADTGDRSVETAELLELAGVTDVVARHLSSKGSVGNSIQWPGGSISSQLRKLMGIQSSSSSSPKGSMHRKLLIYYGPQATHGFLLSYTLSLQLDTSSGNSNAVLLSNPATSTTSSTATSFKLATETAVGRLIPAPGARVLPPVVSQVKPGSPVTMTLSMYLQIDAAMKAAAAGTGTAPDELMATVDEAISGVQALQWALDAASVSSSYSVGSIAVQPSAGNKANIEACEAYVAKAKPVQGVGGLSGAAYAALVVIPVVVGLEAGLRLLFVMRARRRAAAAAASTIPTIVPAINIGPMKMGLAGTAAAPAAAPPEPVVGIPYNGSYCSAGHRTSNPGTVVSPFAACQPGFAYAAPAVGSAMSPGHSAHYGGHITAHGSKGYPAVPSGKLGPSEKVGTLLGP